MGPGRRIGRMWGVGWMCRGVVRLCLFVCVMAEIAMHSTGRHSWFPDSACVADRVSSSIDEVLLSMGPHAEQLHWVTACRYAPAPLLRFQVPKQRICPDLSRNLPRSCGPLRSVQPRRRPAPSACRPMWLTWRAASGRPSTRRSRWVSVVLLVQGLVQDVDEIHPHKRLDPS